MKHLYIGIILLQYITTALTSDPKFDPTTRMRLVLIPADAAVGSVIYRLRASDEEFDYPLTFELMGTFKFHLAIKEIHHIFFIIFTEFNRLFIN